MTAAPWFETRFFDALLIMRLIEAAEYGSRVLAITSPGTTVS
jgi:hypothetical protein